MHVLTAHDELSEDFPLTGDRVTVGRSSENDLQISSALVSRKHCALVKTPEGWTVEDLGSINRTFVNGRGVDQGRPVLLQAGDVLQLNGSVYFTYKIDLERTEPGRKERAVQDTAILDPGLERRFNAIDLSLEALEKQFDAVGGQQAAVVVALKTDIEALQSIHETLMQRMDQTEGRYTAIQAQQGEMLEEIKGNRARIQENAFEISKNLSGDTRALQRIDELGKSFKVIVVGIGLICGIVFVQNFLQETQRRALGDAVVEVLLEEGGTQSLLGIAISALVFKTMGGNASRIIGQNSRLGGRQSEEGVEHSDGNFGDRGNRR